MRISVITNNDDDATAFVNGVPSTLVARSCSVTAVVDVAPPRSTTAAEERPPAVDAKATAAAAATGGEGVRTNEGWGEIVGTNAADPVTLMIQEKKENRVQVPKIFMVCDECDVCDRWLVPAVQFSILDAGGMS